MSEIEGQTLNICILLVFGYLASCCCIYDYFGFITCYVKRIADKSRGNFFFMICWLLLSAIGNALFVIWTSYVGYSQTGFLRVILNSIFAVGMCVCVLRMISKEMSFWEMVGCVFLLVLLEAIGIAVQRAAWYWLLYSREMSDEWVMNAFMQYILIERAFSIGVRKLQEKCGDIKDDIRKIISNCREIFSGM